MIIGDWIASVGEDREGNVGGEYGLRKRGNRGVLMVKLKGPR